jgi:hypothetical protein
MSDLSLAKTESQELAVAEIDALKQKAAAIQVTGDLKGMTLVQKAEFLANLARAEGIPCFPAPYAIGVDKKTGKESIISKKTRAEALRNRDRISLETRYFGPLKVGEKVDEMFWQATVRATAPDGRVDENVGIVFLGGLLGEDKSNKMMAALTKAENRVTYSICGASMVDETEADSAGFKVVPAPPLQGPRVIQPGPALTSSSTSSTLSNTPPMQAPLEAEVVSSQPKPPVAAPKG